MERENGSARSVLAPRRHRSRYASHNPHESGSAPAQARRQLTFGFVNPQLLFRRLLTLSQAANPIVLVTMVRELQRRWRRVVYGDPRATRLMALPGRDDARAPPS